MARMQSSGMNITSSSGGGSGGGSRGVRSASGRGAVRPALKGKLAEPKSGVRVKPPAKTKPAPANIAKVNYKNSDSAYRNARQADRQYEKDAGTMYNPYEAQYIRAEAAADARYQRKSIISGKKISTVNENKATTPRATKDIKNSNPWVERKKINSAVKSAPKNKATVRGLKAANKKK